MGSWPAAWAAQAVQLIESIDRRRLVRIYPSKQSISRSVRSIMRNRLIFPATGFCFAHTYEIDQNALHESNPKCIESNQKAFISMLAGALANALLMLIYPLLSLIP